MKKVIQKVLAIASLALCFGLCFGGRVFAVDATHFTNITYWIEVNNSSKQASMKVYGDVANVACSEKENWVIINTNATSNVRVSNLGCGEKKSETVYIGGNQAPRYYFTNVRNIEDQLKKGGFTISDKIPEIVYTKKTTVSFTGSRAGVPASTPFYVTILGETATVECRYDVVYVSTEVKKDVPISAEGHSLNCGEVKNRPKGVNTSGTTQYEYYYVNVDKIVNDLKKNDVEVTYVPAPAPGTDPDPGEKQQDPGKGGEENPEVPGTGDSDVSKPTFDYDDSGNPGDYSASILVGCSGVESGDGEGIICIINLVVDIMTVGVGILSVIGITVVGIQYLTAGGSEDRTKKAKRRLLEIVIGVGLYVVLYVVLKWLLPRF